MFARQVTLKLKGDSIAEFPRIIENTILPLLQRQKGFRDEITLLNTELSEAIGISLWDTEEDAEVYNRTGYPEVAEALSEVLIGTPTVQVFEVANSTFHKVIAKTA
jgi:heme-degrading monooxygenase HmoA